MDESLSVLPRGDYRDPLEILIMRESKTCAGCVWVAVAFDTAYCSRGKRFGRRCGDFCDAEAKDGKR